MFVVPVAASVMRAYCQSDLGMQLQVLCKLFLEHIEGFQGFKQQSHNECKVLNVCPQEVAQPYEGADHFDVSQWLGILDGFGLLFSGLDSFQS
jgi:hypothetical protein